MKSDVIKIDSKGNGFREAIEQTGKTAVFTGRAGMNRWSCSL